MKILLASDNYKYHNDGVARVVVSLAESFRSLGHDVRVLSPSNSLKSFKRDRDYFIRSVPAPYYPGLRLSFNLRDALIKELLDWKPDIIHLHTEGAIALIVDQMTKVRPVPVVMTVHTNYTYYLFGRFREIPLVKRAIASIGYFFYRRADYLIAPSEKVLSFPYMKHFFDHIRVIPNGIDPKAWEKTISQEAKAALYKKYRLKDNGYTLVMVSRLSKEKNMQEILHYLPSLLKIQPEIQLIIVGDGPYRKKLEAICERYKLTDHVRFTGMLPFDQVHTCYALGDLFVSASTFEVHSIAYLEALACGLPMVVREDDSVKGLIKEGKNGYTYRTKSEFCRYVLRILRNRKLHEKMHQEAVLTLEDFTVEKCVERTLSLYHEILHHEILQGVI